MLVVDTFLLLLEYKGRLSQALGSLFVPDNFFMSQKFASKAGAHPRSNTTLKNLRATNTLAYCPTTFSSYTLMLKNNTLAHCASTFTIYALVLWKNTLAYCAQHLIFLP